MNSSQTTLAVAAALLVVVTLSIALRSRPEARPAQVVRPSEQAVDPHIALPGGTSIELRVRPELEGRVDSRVLSEFGTTLSRLVTEGRLEVKFYSLADGPPNYNEPVPVEQLSEVPYEVRTNPRPAIKIAEYDIGSLGTTQRSSSNRPEVEMSPALDGILTIEHERLQQALDAAYDFIDRAAGAAKERDAISASELTRLFAVEESDLTPQTEKILRYRLQEWEQDYSFVRPSMLDVTNTSRISIQLVNAKGRFAHRMPLVVENAHARAQTY